jgi:hypothetical protein
MYLELEIVFLTVAAAAEAKNVGLQKAGPTNSPSTSSHQLHRQQTSQSKGHLYRSPKAQNFALNGF